MKSLISHSSYCVFVVLTAFFVLGCKKSEQPTSDVKSLEAISGFSDKISCKVGKNAGSKPPLNFLGKVTTLDSKQLAAWAAVVSALPSKIRAAVQQGALKLSHASQCEARTNKSSALDVDLGCLQFQVTPNGTPSVVQVAGLTTADEILTHGVRLLTLAYLNLEQRLYLAGIGNRSLQEGLINESAQIAISFLKDLEALERKGLVSKQRLKLIGDEVRSSPQLFSAVILAHAVESISCGELSSVKSRFPEVVARYQGSKKSQSISQMLGTEQRASFGLDNSEDEVKVEGSNQNSKNAPYGSQSAIEAKEALSSLDPKAHGDVFEGFATSDFAFDKGREATVIPNMSLRIGNAIVQDPRSGVPTDKDAVMSEAKRLNFPYPAMKNLESFVDDGANASVIHAQYKARTAPKSGYYEKLEKSGLNSSSHRDTDRQFDYMLNSGAYLRGFVPLTTWMNGSEMYGRDEDGVMKKYKGNSKIER